MAEKNVDDDSPDRSAEEAALTRIYRAAANEQPPVALDARILAAAREPNARSRRLKRWAVPLAIAATVVLSVSVVLELSRQGVVEQEDTTLKSAAAPEPAASPAVPEQKAAAVSEDARAKQGETMPSEVSKLKKDVTPAAPARERADKLEPMRDAGPLLQQKGAEVAAMVAKEAHGPRADVTHVQVSGSPGSYYFSVTVRSPDKGCAQYADWWEVVSADGKVLYRRVLLHSHTDEQPFERSGGPVPIQPETPIWVRAHMNALGYGGAALRGSVKSGFAAASPPSDFAADAAKQPPLPDGCAF